MSMLGADNPAQGGIASWFDTCHRAGVSLGAATAMGERLSAAYQEPHRRYHTLDHIDACLSLVAEAPLQPQERVLVELATWFHDAVYNPRAADNEARSAEMARSWMDQNRVEGAGEVAALIEMTAGHTVSANDSPSMQLFHDVDLAILGSTPADYGTYTDQIRAEYAFLTTEQFNQGRAQVLKGLLGQPEIYVLAPYRQALEASARNNMGAELDRLGQT